MSGRIKHMERSHRSVSAKRNSGVFNHFHRNAYNVAMDRTQRNMTFGQGLVAALKKAAGFATRKES